MLMGSGFHIQFGSAFLVLDVGGLHAGWRGKECAWTHDSGWNFGRFKVTLGWKDGLRVWRFDNGAGWQIKPGRYGLTFERLPLFPEYRGSEMAQAA